MIDSIGIAAMTEIQQLFYELFFGTYGGWIGFTLMASIMVLVTSKEKYAGILFMPVSIMIGVMMTNELAVNNDLWWCCLMYFLMPGFLFLIMYLKSR